MVNGQTDRGGPYRHCETHEARRKDLDKDAGKIWIRIFPDKPLSKKPLETRMGKGKGAVEFWVAPVKPGRILFEIEGVSKEMAFQALRLAGAKLPVKTQIVEWEDI